MDQGERGRIHSNIPDSRAVKVVDALTGRTIGEVSISGDDGFVALGGRTWRVLGPGRGGHRVPATSSPEPTQTTTGRAATSPCAPPSTASPCTPRTVADDDRVVEVAVPTEQVARGMVAGRTAPPIGPRGHARPRPPGRSHPVPWGPREQVEAPPLPSGAPSPHRPAHQPSCRDLTTSAGPSCSATSSTLTGSSAPAAPRPWPSSRS